MEKYCVNGNQTQNPGFHHEVHTESHANQLGISSKIDLGYHSGCASAVSKAKEHYSDADGCATCCPQCHRG